MRKKKQPVQKYPRGSVRAWTGGSTSRPVPHPAGNETSLEKTRNPILGRVGGGQLEKTRKPLPAQTHHNLSTNTKPSYATEGQNKNATQRKGSHRKVKDGLSGKRRKTKTSVSSAELQKEIGKAPWGKKKHWEGE